MMRFAVVGVGAIGGYFGARLIAGGNDVCLVARGATLKSLQKDGLRVESPKGDLRLRDVRATDRPKQIGPVDCILLGVKAWQVREAAHSIRPLLGDQTCVLPLQNGVEAPTELSQELGKQYALGGLCWIISSLVKPGHVRHTGVEPYIAFGELDNRKTARVERLLQTLTASGIKADIPPDIVTAMWEKFVFICSVSGVGAVTRASVGEIRRHAETRDLLEQSMREIVAVAKGHGTVLRPDLVDERMAFVDSLPEEGTASMQRDLMEGRPSELEAQNGAVIRLGRAIGVQTPVNDFIYRSLLISERKARKEL